MAEKRDELRQFTVTPLQTNCYAYVSAGECLVVDPGGSGAAVAEHLDDVRVTCVAATHGHGDHVGGVAALCHATGAPFAIHAADAELARHAGEMSEVGRSYDENAPAADRLLAEGDVIKVGTATFTVMETPGHTPGGIVLVGGGSAEGLAFVGDTLFPGQPRPHGPHRRRRARHPELASPHGGGDRARDDAAVRPRPCHVYGRRAREKPVPAVGGLGRTSFSSAAPHFSSSAKKVSALDERTSSLTRIEGEKLVPEAGLEPARVASTVFETVASANSATRAWTPCVR